MAAEESALIVAGTTDAESAGRAVRAQLSPHRAEADFAGLYEPKRPSGGWHSPDLPAFEPDEPSTDDTEFLRGLMAVGQGQLEFLSG